MYGLVDPPKLVDLQPKIHFKIIKWLIHGSIIYATMDEYSQILAEWVFVDGEASTSKLHRQNLIHEAQQSPKHLKGEEQFEKTPNCSYALFFS